MLRNREQQKQLKIYLISYQNILNDVKSLVNFILSDILHTITQLNYLFPQSTSLDVRKLSDLIYRIANNQRMLILE